MKVELFCCRSNPSSQCLLNSPDSPQTLPARWQWYHLKVVLFSHSIPVVSDATRVVCNHHQKVPLQPPPLPFSDLIWRLFFTQLVHLFVSCTFHCTSLCLENYPIYFALCVRDIWLNFPPSEIFELLLPFFDCTTILAGDLIRWHTTQKGGKWEWGVMWDAG